MLRGEDLLPSTPRQIVLYQALAQIGVGSGRVPTFGHLPTVLGDGNRRLSKRDKGSGLAEYREQGYLPEALLNYLALLGWAIADDRDVFTIEEMVEAFDILRVNANPAKFDAKKCEAINAAHIRRLSTDELADQLVPFLVAAGLVGRAAHAGAVVAAGRRHPADPGADDHPVGGGGADAGSCSPPTTTWRSTRRRRCRPPPGPVLDAAAEAVRAVRAVRSRRDRGGAALGPDRGSGAEAEAGLRPGPGGGHRAQDLAAAVRVARAARPRVVAGPDRGGPGRPVDRPDVARKSRSRSGNPAVRGRPAPAKPTSAVPVVRSGPPLRPASCPRRCRRTAPRTRRSCAVRATSGGARCSGWSAGCRSIC